ncbi:uncharacterized protein LOC118189365 [Stegodyphus dumicola]|uniref:uncharacterized protein LOC118189365 n=1 Tax=Stegodyphus dumicola TaxID=202533 RepID=UPI0015ADFDA9|nr:uncharacterized protein LOC118189365 [Stegodyphus dumicola]
MVCDFDSHSEGCWLGSMRRHGYQYEAKPNKFFQHPALGLPNLQCNINSPPPTTEFIAYTDGSKIEEKVGSGVTFQHHSTTIQEWQGHLQNQNSVHQAELTAIQESIQTLQQLQADPIHIITDSQSSIYAIKNLDTNSPIVRNIQILISNWPHKHILSWTRGHNSCEGNERADHLAKQAALKQVGTLITHPWPKSSLKQHLKKLAIMKWQHNWNQEVQGRRTYSLIPQVNINRCITNYYLTQYITGHGPFPKNLHERNLTQSSLCTCGEEGDADHYMFYCPITEEHYIRHPTDLQLPFKKFLITHLKVHHQIKNIIDKLN